MLSNRIPRSATSTGRSSLNAPFGAGRGWFRKNVARDSRPVVSTFEVGSLKFFDF